jgi:MFS family permease
MEDLSASSSIVPSTLLESQKSGSTDLPEALQPPTKPVSSGFSTRLAAANFVLYICWVGVGSLLLPLQVEQMDKANKIGILGIGLGLSALLALLIAPIAGAFSDRTISRFGRRRPWIFVGAIISAVALVIMIQAGNVVILFLGWGLFQTTSNLIFTTLNAIIPDQVPDTQRGSVSGIVGMSIPFGFILAGILVALTSPVISYAALIAIVLVILIPYALFLQDKVLSQKDRASFNLWAFLKSFWINPRKHPDFGWAWLTRFLTNLGYYMGPSFLIYYLQDAVHYPQKQIAQGAATVLITATLVSLVFILIGGVLSDRFQRRKIFVIIANVIIALGLLLQGILPIWTIVLFAAGLVGLGYGIYTSVDMALITQVLPSAKDRAKDLGIINIATTLPQSLAPLMAALLVSLFHSYAILFTTAALITLLSGILIQPIKSVR